MTGNAKGRNKKKSNSRLSQKQRNDTESNSTSGYDRTASSNNESNNSSWLISSASDGRSTSSSGENFAAVRVTSTSRINADKSKSKTPKKAPNLTQNQRNESLRWNCEYEDPTLEEERLKLYKMNRRKRYLGFLQERVGGDTEKSYYA